ncbi:TetR/AcrR family transcriptional regulator [Pseudovibrio ascidiaceicola]|uniref:TetR/AcrR family transcriptional regulator n=1 Tax=Pseudovibrio ascidiaceicola TaxID=285279 RepID=UPI000D68F817|nr:TetR/AcrR family transcriptional regulator [Pseudovibrio ascidiaceicola]
MSSDEPIKPDIPIPELENLFDASIRVFLEKGIKAATMKDVSEAVGVSLDTLEDKFTSKQGLVVAALSWYYLKYSQQMQSVMALHSDIYSAMQAAFMEFTELCCDEIKAEKGLFWLTLIDLGYVDKDLWEQFQGLQFNWEDQIRDKLVQCQNELKDPGEIELLTGYFMLIFEGLYEMVKFGMPEEKIFKLIEVSLEALGSRMKTGGR